MNGLYLLFSHGSGISVTGGPAAISVATGFKIIFLMSILGLVGLAERVLLGFAAYHDARAKSNPDAAMWGLLVGFLGLIPGIIYLCIRNSSRTFTVCTSCGCTHAAADMNCPKCGAPNPASSQYVNPFAEQQAHRAKVEFIIALVLIGLGVLMAAAAAIGFAAIVFSAGGSRIIY